MYRLTHKPNLLIVWDADYPWDIRVSKIARTLIREGLGVSMVCRNLNNSKSFEIYEGIKLYRLLPISSSNLNNILSFPVFFNVFWFLRVYRVAKKERIEVILVRDLPLSPLAIIVGRLLRIPVVMDMAENYPAMLQDTRRFGKFFWANFLLRNSTLAQWIEFWTVKRMSKVLVVTEENKKRLIGLGVLARNIWLVSNTPDLDDLYEQSGKKMELDEAEFFLKRFTLIYIGGLGPIRGLEMVVQAMPEIVKRIPDAHLLVIGKGEKRTILERLAQMNNVIGNVTLKGWVDFKYISLYIKCCSVGLIPHRSTEHTNTTIPNKIFDYMAFGLPVLASDTLPMKRIVEDANCGLVFRADNTQSFIEAVLKMHSINRKILGLNGKRAVEKLYNWKVDSAMLLCAIEELPSPSSQG